MPNKTTEFWFALVAGIVFVLMHHREKPLIARVGIAGVSGAMGFALAGEASVWTGRSETLAAMVITAFGYLALDLGAAIFADRETIKAIIMRRLGGPK